MQPEVSNDNDYNAADAITLPTPSSTEASAINLYPRAHEHTDEPLAGSSEPAIEMAERGTATAKPPSPDYKIPVHPVCDLFPRMPECDLTKLAASIREKGLLHPIVLHNGELVDGRNRLLACRQAGVEPHFVEWRDILRRRSFREQLDLDC